MRELSGAHAWADEDDDLAWTVAAIQGRGVDEVLVAYGGAVHTSLGELTFHAANAWRNEHLDEIGVVRLRPIGRYVVAIEPNGWRGSGTEVARQTSAGDGAFFSVYWSPTGYRILQAEAGDITGQFEPIFVGLPAGAADMLPGWVEPDDFPLDHVRSACLAAMERQTGLAFDRAWLDDRWPTYRIPA